MPVFRFPTRLLKCEEFELDYRTENGLKYGTVKLSCGCIYATDNEETLRYINRFYQLKGRKENTV
jgi:hypothetical protein